eukprot:jgi/Mesvir1/2372/Mv22128-RA.1
MPREATREERMSRVPRTVTVAKHPDGSPAIAFQAISEDGTCWGPMVCPSAKSVTKLDGGAGPLVITMELAKMCGATRENGGLIDSTVLVEGWKGPAARPDAMTSMLINVILNPTDPKRMACVAVPALVVDRCGYAALIGMDVMYRLGLIIDPWLEVATYRRDWQGEGKQKALLPIQCSSDPEPNPQGVVSLDACVAAVVSPASIEVEPGDAAENWGGGVWPDTQAVHMAQAASDKHARAIGTGALPKGAGGKRRQPGAITPYPGFSAEVLERIPDFGRATVVLELFAAQFPPSAWADVFGEGTHDVRFLGQQQLRRLISQHGEVGLVIAGWECQGMSQAGHGRGLADSRSGLFWDMVRIVGELQQLQQVPPAYLFENVVAVDSPSPTVREDWGTIVGILGEPVVSDNAGLGGNTYRLRAFWTNIAGQGSTHAGGDAACR